MSGPSILLIPDGGPRIGGGHVMRCLTLAGALQSRGAQCAFVVSPFAAPLLDRFAPVGIGRRPAADDSPAAVLAAAIEAACASDAVVFDHFRFGAADHAQVRGGGRVVMAVDDLADRPLDVDLLLDPGPGRRADDYAGLLPTEATLMAGADYALVRAEFATLRNAALARRAEAGDVARVLVQLGLTDVDGITARVVNRLLPRLGQARLDVVLGRAATSLDGLSRLASRDERITLHVETTDMAELCAAADLAVGAGGSSLWERCVVGLPAVLVVLADNQRPGSTAAEQAGAAVAVDARTPDFDAALDRAFTSLMRSADRRMRMGRAAAALCDGRGAERAADALLAAVTSTRG